LNSDPLFHLVKSLVAAEKRYFVQQASRYPKGKEGHVLRLFRLLDQQTTYDEAALKASLAGEPLGKQYAVQKMHLQQAILRALQGFHYERSAGMQLRSQLDKIELLVEKAQHATALKCVAKAMAFAEESGQTGLQLDLLNWERRLLRHLAPLNHLAQLPALAARQAALLDRLHAEQAALLIYDELFGLVQTERRLEKQTLQARLAPLLVRIQDAAAAQVSSFESRAALLNAEALACQLQADYPGMQSAYAALLAHWEVHPRRIALDPERHARGQVAWLNSTVATGSISHYLPEIRALRRFPVQGSMGRARAIFQSYNLELLLLMEQGSKAPAFQFLVAFQSRLPELLPFVDTSRLSALYMNAALLYFRVSDYGGALTWVRLLLAQPGLDHSVALCRSAALLLLVCHAELGDFDAADAQLIALRRRLRRQDTDWEFGNLVLNRLGMILTRWGSEEASGLRREFEMELRGMTQRMQAQPLALNWMLAWAAREG
jgi:hypothetical protein